MATVIAKDMSRLERDYLKVGYYTEIFFVERDVRYIAINDGVDSAKGDNAICRLARKQNGKQQRNRKRRHSPCRGYTV